MFGRALILFAMAAISMAEKNSKDDQYLTVYDFVNFERFTKAAKSEFIKRHGLADLEQFEQRKEIIDLQWNLAKIEFYNPDNMKEFLGSMGRFAFAAKDYYELAMQVKSSENFRIIKDRIRATPTSTYMKRLFMSYGDVATMFYDDQIEEAGEYLVKAMFPKRYKTHQNIGWGLPAPYNEYEGDLSSGILAGMIQSMTGEQNYDNLAKCIHPAHVVDQSFGTYYSKEKRQRGATNLITLKHNEDMWQAMVQMHQGFQNLDTYVTECSSKTQEQVAKIKEMHGKPGDLNKAEVMDHLKESSEYLDKKVAQVMLKNAMHNYYEMGKYVAEIYVQLTVFDEKHSDDFYRDRTLL